MCKGLELGNTPGSCLKESVSPHTNRPVPRSVNCELCESRAALYCQADDAYLCRKCDRWVHEANFLALRHVRCFLCNTCQNLTQRYLVGASPTTVSWSERRRHCDSDMETRHSTKTPFLFL
ncbi:microProtein 1a, B-box domain protein 31 [Hibiscus trionum]|uniref:MicroProtein 1a, B-box domain protein 31 n=1 Tax=Hibiscus trionum TaxID=183268 RepID=A0A9W7MGJ4_HIBTR|nr:microProtein 1a, B-box domain protein 31 [Hibiscus trionum]